MHDLRVIFDMCGARHLAAQHDDVVRAACLFELPSAGELLFYGQDVYLRARLVHGEQRGVDHLMLYDVEHFGAQLVCNQRHGSLLYQAGSYHGFLDFGSLWRYSVFGIYLKRWVGVHYFNRNLLIVSLLQV